MPLESQNLDDRNYKQIVDEIKQLIPAYAPEWTDWNEHDPGITLIELFSHLSEMIIYRLNQVPDKNYIEFMKLTGIELKPATPAMAPLTFTLTEPLPEEEKDYIIVPKGTLVETEPIGDEDPIQLETDSSLIAVSSEIKRAQFSNEIGYYRIENINQGMGNSFYPFGERAEVGSALYLGLTKSLPDEEIGVRVEVFSDEKSPPSGNCVPDDGSINPPARFSWEYFDGDRWENMNLVKDETMSFTRSGYVFFKAVSTMKASLHGAYTDEEEDELYWIRCMIVDGGYDSPPRLQGLLLNTVQATNAVTIKGEIIGGSDGTANQSFSVKNMPILKDSLVLRVEGKENTEEWKRVDNFNESERKDRHFTLDGLTGEIKFGDGRKGRIPRMPLPGEDDKENIVIDYRYGGGEVGNVGPGTITSLVSSVRHVEEVTNYMPSSGGGDEESIESAKERAPMELKTRHRAVTVEDFEFFARQTPGVKIARAKAIPLYHPEFSYDIKVPGVVSVIIVPDCDNDRPAPSEAVIRMVCKYLNSHRLLTTELHVVAPRYKEVKIEADIVAGPRYDLAEVRERVINSLKKFYHPLFGGRSERGWPFGGDICISDAYRQMLDLEPADCVRNLKIYVDGEEVSEEMMQIDEYYLVCSGEHDIKVSYERE